jgi:ABC-type polysaccharide/polyol phosphate transport system ATPase subunit
MSDSLQNNQKNNETVIQLQDISVRYRIPNESIRTLKEYLIRLLQGRIKHNDFWALKNVSFHINRGEVFGIIGRNGAGKSTLLKVISKVLIPVNGHVWVKGHISPLLQIGAGFHDELTGLENIYLNATLLGHSRSEIDEMVGEIIAFAEIGDFLESPLRTYSSGMKSRLGFAVATAWQPDILILDEVLAVGDSAFRTKCFYRMKQFHDNGATILFVSHDIGQVNAFCNRAIWLDKGDTQIIGPAQDVCKFYEESVAKSSEEYMTKNTGKPN